MRRHTDTSTDPARSGPVKSGIITSVDRDGETLAAGDDATVRITKEHGSSVTALVPQPTAGDQRLPRVGQRGYYIRASSGTRVLLGVAGTEHSGYSETRRVDHPHSDAYIEFDDTGTFTVVTDNGTEATADSTFTVVTDDGTEVTADSAFTVVTNDGTEVTADSAFTVTTNNGTEVTADSTFTVITNDGTTVTVGNGAVTIDGTEITVDNGTVKINGGGTPVVTDVNTTTDSDGHVTSVTPVTDDTIQV